MARPKSGIKHLIECHCVLPQYRNRDRLDSIYHRFVVFSVIDTDDNMVPKYAQCNNCGVIHKIIDVMTSEVALGNDSDAAVLSIDDIKLSLPENVVNILASYDADLPTWEEAAFLVENKQWGGHVVLTRDENEIAISGKILKFNGPLSLKIEPYYMKISLT